MFYFSKTRILKDLLDSPEAAKRQVDTWIKELCDAVQDPGDGELLCGLSRRITGATMLAKLPQYSELWTEERTEAVFQVVTRTALVAEETNSKYKLNCIDRPRQIIELLTSVYTEIGNEAGLAFLARLGREYSDAIEKGVPLLLVA